MKKKLAAFLAMMMALVTMSSAAIAEEEKPTITAHKANAITIDGDLSDWDLSSPAVLDDASQIIRDLSFWQGPNDLSAKVYAAYDEENLYLAFDVTEDTPYGAIEMLPHTVHAPVNRWKNPLRAGGEKHARKGGCRFDNASLVPPYQKSRFPQARHRLPHPHGLCSL